MTSSLLGIDIGATKISTGLVSTGGMVSAQRKILTEVRKGRARVLDNLYTAIRAYPRGSYRGIGIGIMGAVDWRKGVSRGADKLPTGWRHVPLAQVVKKRFRVPVSVDNDANAFTLGAALREARAYTHVIGITLGSGIGGGFVTGCRVYHGKDNCVTEVGHTIVDIHSTSRCPCGQYGHLETLASGWGIATRYYKLTGQRVTPHEIEDRLRQKDRSARLIFVTMTKALGAALANIIAMHNPDVIAIGGGLSRFPGYVTTSILHMKKLVSTLPVSSTPVLQIKNPEAANIRGAAFLSRKFYHLD